MSAAQAEARGGMHGALVAESWTERIETAMYGAMIVGYLYAVLAPGHFKLPGFLLLTVSCAAWVALYRYISATVCVRYFKLAFAGLVVTTTLAQSAAFWGVSLDWLAPVLTVGFVAAVLSLRWALVLSAGMTITTLAIIALLGGPPGQSALASIWNGINVVPAYAFAFLFSRCLTMIEQQRDQARHLVEQIEDAHQQLQAHAKEAEELAVAQERNRMAREIHDTLGHYLTILAVQLETARKLYERGDPRLGEELTEARRAAAECLTEVRRSVAALRPAELSSASFGESLSHLVGELEAVAPDVEITFDLEGPTQDLGPELRVALYRCAQEALTNVRKHARATKVLLRVRADDEVVELTVLDNGIGPDSDGAEPGAPGVGLIGMRERIALLGGTVEVGPEPERGWRVEVRAPRGVSEAPATVPTGMPRAETDAEAIRALARTAMA